MSDRGRPEPGRQYRLTGADTPSIMAGSTWAESEIRSATVLVRDGNGNTLGRVEIEGVPPGTGATVEPYDNGEGWVVTLAPGSDHR